MTPTELVLFGCLVVACAIAAAAALSAHRADARLRDRGHPPDPQEDITRSELLEAHALLERVAADLRDTQNRRYKAEDQRDALRELLGGIATDRHRAWVAGFDAGRAGDEQALARLLAVMRTEAERTEPRPAAQPEVYATWPGDRPELHCPACSTVVAIGPPTPSDEARP